MSKPCYIGNVRTYKELTKIGVTVLTVAFPPPLSPPPYPVSSYSSLRAAVLRRLHGSMYVSISRSDAVKRNHRAYSADSPSSTNPAGSSTGSQLFTSASSS